MPAKYIGLLIFIWVVAAIIGGVMERTYLGESEAAVLDCILSFQAVTEDQEVGTVEIAGPWTGITRAVGWLNSVWKMVTFQFAFIHGEWILAKWLILAPLMGTIVFGLIMMFFGQFQRAV